MSPGQLVARADGALWATIPGGATGAVLRTVAPVVVSSEEVPEGEVPEGEAGKPGVELGAAYPNPSSRLVTVPLTLAEAADVRVAVYDALGRAVAVLHEGWLAAGTHWLVLDEAGLYLVRVEGGGA